MFRNLPSSLAVQLSDLIQSFYTVTVQVSGTLTDLFRLLHQCVCAGTFTERESDITEREWHHTSSSEFFNFLFNLSSQPQISLHTHHFLTARRQIHIIRESLDQIVWMCLAEPCWARIPRGGECQGDLGLHPESSPHPFWLSEFTVRSMLLCV